MGSIFRVKLEKSPGNAVVRLSLILLLLFGSAFGDDFELDFSYNETASGAGQQIFISQGRLLHMRREKYGEPDSPITPWWIERSLSQGEFDTILKLLASFEVSSWEDSYEDVLGAGTKCPIYTWSLRFKANGLKESETGLCSKPPEFDQFRSALIETVESKHDN